MRPAHKIRWVGVDQGDVERAVGAERSGRVEVALAQSPAAVAVRALVSSLAGLALPAVEVQQLADNLLLIIREPKSAFRIK
jgi:hypothetical protein